jgi:NADPH2:quinone reductase
MTCNTPKTQLQLRSLVTSSGHLELSLAEIPTPDPAANEVLVRVEAAPINPSDLGLLLGAADMATATVTGTAARAVVQADIPPKLMPGMAGRLDQSMPVGNEGAGVVVAAGSAESARALLGKTVAFLGGASYSQYRSLLPEQCLVLPDDTSAAEGASAFVNPLTALCMIETMRREGHTALVHTAAASNLGQMLQKLCIAENVRLVNIVRTEEQVMLLKDLGATHVYNSRSPEFTRELTDALAATAATLAFDAIGGGPLAGQILSAMERAIGRSAKAYSRYGSTIHKQVYVYGGLDTRPTDIVRDFGMAWGIGGWLVTPVLEKIGAPAVVQMKQRIARELKTTFASHYSRVISLAETLHLDDGSEVPHQPESSREIHIRLFYRDVVGFSSRCRF